MADGRHSKSKSARPVSLQRDDSKSQFVEKKVGQSVRLIPGSSLNSGNSLWIVLPEGCTLANPTLADCPNLRGYTFSRNTSTSWSTQGLQTDGLYELATLYERKLGLTGNAYYGFDTVSLGLPGSEAGGVVVQDALIAGYATSDFWLGSLGLSPVPFNFTDFNDPVPSLLSQLREAGQIRGSNWAYTAGAHYTEPASTGSLTLGGYDSARFNSTALATIPTSGDLNVGIQSIVHDTRGSSPLLGAPGIYATINSLITHMWLPLSVCEAFESAFNLTWNDTAQLYLLDGNQHSLLKAQNPTFTFTIGAKSAGGSADQIVDIVLPYSAFDVNVTAPLIDESEGSRFYFPLKRAQNSSQYTLGRVFLQEAHIFMDYDRAHFEIAQAVHSNLETVSNVTAVAAPVTTTSSIPSESSSLSTGAIAGIAVGGVVILVLLAGVAVFCVRRRRRRGHRLTAPPAYEEPLTGNETQQIDAKIGEDALIHEVHGDGVLGEMPASNPIRELDGTGTERPELDGQYKKLPIRNESISRRAELP